MRTAPMKEFFKSSAALVLLGGAAACAPPPRDVPPVLDLRVCVEGEAAVELYARHFKGATATGPCDVTVRDTALNAGKVTVRSAYDQSVLAEIEGPVDLAPQLVKLALARGTQAYRKVSAQRAADLPR